MPVGDPKLAQIKIDRFTIITVGEPAPLFAGKSLGEEAIKLESLRGKVVLIDFWATWCSPCVAEMPNIRSVYEKYGKDGAFTVLGVSLDDDAKKVKRFVKKENVAWPQIVAGPAQTNDIAKKYFVEGIPATFLIDPEGKVIAKDLRGPALEEAVRRAVRKAEESRPKRELVHEESTEEKTARVGDPSP